MMKVLLLPLCLLLNVVPEPSAAYKTEAECQTEFLEGNAAFLQGLNTQIQGDPRRVSNLPLRTQVCVLYYLWKKEEDYFKKLPEDQAICHNVWGQYQPIPKETFIKLCTGQMAY